MKRFTILSGAIVGRFHAAGIVLFVGILGGSPAAGTTAAASEPEPVEAAGEALYRDEIKPLLNRRCYACHGSLKQEAGLRLDTAESILLGADGAPIIDRDAVDESELLIRIRSEDDGHRMPPEGEPLTADQVDALTRWIASGAVGPADESPESDPTSHWAFQPPRKSQLPVSADFAQAENPIDAFLGEALARQGLVPRPPVAKEVWLRRVYLDLVGLLPTVEELADYLADDSPLAEQRVVDRLLDSPAYGERWGRHWMDIWRYSDWFGRRYVPDVWNSAPQIWRWRDRIVESLNRDLGYDQMIREMLAADEVVPDDPQAGVATGYLIRNWYALNPNDWMRSTVEHTGKAFLGLTFHCAHCHDHKYDPISQEDYFRFRAFFEPISIRQDRVAGEPDPGPFQEYQYSTLRKVQRLGSVRVFDKQPDAATWFYTGGDERNRVESRGSIPPGIPDIFAPDGQPLIEPIELPAVAWYPALAPSILRTIRQEHLTALQAAESELAALPEPAAAEPEPDAETDVETETETETVAEADAETDADDWQRDAAVAKVAAAGATLAALDARIAAELRAHGIEPADADEVKAAASEAEQAERLAAVTGAKAAVAAAILAVRTAEAKPETDEKRAEELAAAQKVAEQAAANLTAAEVAADAEATGVYTPLGPTYPRTSTGRRAALANWITSPSNPLTARVAVNHIWARHFHAPLVASVFDFGRSGSKPTHPELLDWLAVDLMESGWSMKRLHRLIVTSQAYRRDSRAGDGNTPQVAIDPENRMLWRMNVGRMEAEVLRDSLLHLAGKLDRTLGGQEIENTESLTTHRRSLYYSVYPEDGGKSPLGQLFDGPDAADCYRRTRSVVPQQALALTNSDWVHQVAAGIVDRWEQTSAARPQAAASVDETFIRDQFLRILGRDPTAAEQELCLTALASAPATDPVDSATAAASGEATAEAEPAVDQTRSRRESLVRVLLNHNDLITIR
ncbi:MAG: DUF1553 domain-containing protein [Planctomycetaceae bacterium]|nr:MAG: DUF1553 domain-containing protein [Planctomycetaceae bacterium]